MSLDVQTAPGFVFVTCGGETVVVAGVLVAPPAGQGKPLQVPNRTTTWYPSTGAGVPGRSPPPKTGRGGGGVSTQITENMSERFVSLALSSGHVELLSPDVGPLNKLLDSNVFLDFNRTMPGSYALTVSPKSNVTAQKTSAVIGDLAPLVLTKSWDPRG
jgi:hypothetical protein